MRQQKKTQEPTTYHGMTGIYCILRVFWAFQQEHLREHTGRVHSVENIDVTNSIDG